MFGSGVFGGCFYLCLLSIAANQTGFVFQKAVFESQAFPMCDRYDRCDTYFVKCFHVGGCVRARARVSQ